MFGFGSKKSKVVVKTNRTGDIIKRLRFTIGAKTVIALIAFTESVVGHELLPDQLKHGVADLVVTGVGLACDYFSWRNLKPAIEGAANAVNEDAEIVKRAVGVK